MYLCLLLFNLLNTNKSNMKQLNGRSVLSNQLIRADVAEEAEKDENKCFFKLF